MPRITLSGMILGLWLTCLGGILLASEVDELRERAHGLRKEAAVLAEQGNKEQAEQRNREADKLLQAAKHLESKTKERKEKGGQPGSDQKVRHLKERLHELREKERHLREKNAPDEALAEVRDQIAVIEQGFQKGKGKHAERSEVRPEFRPQVEKLEAASRHLHHLRVAAENLKAAEWHDLAGQVMEKAEAMERDLQEAKQRLAAEIHAAEERRGDFGPDVVRELRGEIERLRAEVKELSQKLEKR